jgi:ankyrin repeat protein
MKTALHHASAADDLDMIKVLMEYGSDLDARDMSTNE